MPRTNACLAAALLCGTPMAAAETASPIIVTASRTAQTADTALAPVTVVTRDDIDRIQPRTVLDVLQLQPGIQMDRAGGPGGNVDLYLRGTGSRHTLVLIDGVRAASATTGSFPWQHLDPAQIERIEIVRGPRAALYGADAVGGVIQIFTRQPKGGTSVVLEAGSFDTYRGSIGVAGGRSVRYRLQASVADSEGFDATTSDNFSADPDDDGYRNRSISADITVPMESGAQLEAGGWYSLGDVEFDQGTQETRNLSARVRYELPVNDVWFQTVQAGYALDDAETDSDFPSTIVTRRRNLLWQHDIAWSTRDLATLGLEWRRDGALTRDDSTGVDVYDEAIDNTAAFVQWQRSLGAGDVQFGGRYDKNSEFGGHATAQAAAGWSITEHTRVTGSYGTAFQAPNLNQLFHPGFFGFFAGNPDLDPERSRTAEVGIRHVSGNDRFEANVFYTVVDDLIAFAGTNNQAININEAVIPGIELIHAGDSGPWSYQLAATLQKPRDAKDDSRLIRRPDRKLALQVGRSLGAVGQVHVDWQVVSERLDVGDVELPGYGLLNLGWSKRLGKRLSLNARMENVTDEDYQLLDTYATAGRSVYAGIRYGGQ